MRRIEQECLPLGRHHAQLRRRRLRAQARETTAPSPAGSPARTATSRIPAPPTRSSAPGAARAALHRSCRPPGRLPCSRAPSRPPRHAAHDPARSAALSPPTSRPRSATTPGPKDRRQRQAEQDRRKRQQHIHAPHQHAVQPAIERREQIRSPHRPRRPARPPTKHAISKVRRRPNNRLAHHVPALVVGAQQIIRRRAAASMRPRVRCRTGRREPATGANNAAHTKAKSQLPSSGQYYDQGLGPNRLMKRK